ncbi:MAG: hypothetical protein LBE13_18075 [Bacteroidales bacterium]|jgi:hypothetical protein|nr:hypothetical protein [Bacteroidales bacterium]
MKKTNYSFRVILFAVMATNIIFLSCQKDKIYTKNDAKLYFSEEMITFDTVFTTIGSITKILTVSNPYKSTIKTDISLAGGAMSSFSINVDGISGRSFKDVEIHAKDSIFIFIKVNLDPNGETNPILIADTLTFFTNGNRQNVELIACGEDANFIIADNVLKDNDGNIIMNYKIIADEGENITWTKTKPYVIYGYAVINSNAKLTVEAGTQIYLHKQAGLWVYPEGCIHVNGTKDEPVVFQGDERKLANEYDFAQWDRIWICEGNNDNIINYAEIKNAFIGIQAEVLEKNMGNKLILTNTDIRCSQAYGFLGRGYSVDAYNNVISNCGNYCLSLVQGGNYNFINNTIYNQFSSSQRTTPSVYFSNVYYPSATSSGIASDFKCHFINNIVYGRFQKELNLYSVSVTNFELYVDNCLLKTDQDVLDKASAHSNVLLNQDPKVQDVSKYNFALQNDSPCKSKGKKTAQVSEDITGVIRNDPPSIGAYE